MAITRAQQVKQMLRDGGVTEDISFSIVKPSKDGKRPGYFSGLYGGGAGDRGGDPYGSAQENQEANRTDSGNVQRASDYAKEKARIATTKEKKKLEEIKKKEKEEKEKKEKEAKEKKDAKEFFDNQQKKKKRNFFQTIYDKTKTINRKSYLDNLKKTDPVKYAEMIDELEQLSGQTVPPSMGFKSPDLVFGPPGDEDLEFGDLSTVTTLGGKFGFGEGYDDYMDSRLNTGGGGGDGGNINTTPIIPKSPIEETQEEVNPRDYTGIGSRFLGSQFDFTGLADGGIARAGYMDGGRMKQIEMMEDEDDPVGGIMDLESARDMYFVGGLVKSIKKGVKKATKAVKKIAKSPIGKAALLGAIGFGIPGTSLGGIFGRASFGGAAPGMFGFGGIKNAALLARGNLFGQAGSSKKGLFTKLGLTKGGGSLMPTLKGGLALGLGIPTALDMLGLGKDDDDQMDLDEYYRRNGIDIADIRMNPYNYLASRMVGSKFAADGGLMRMGYQEGGDAEPVAKKTMPLLDMDGMEKDYREDGGFVPIGRMERADDVPARLSKNEFVFTADAVRNAGEGDIDKGAEVMYNMMKNLESGGEVSEESQGLDGAREMFKTSQRLEEVL